MHYYMRLLSKGAESNIYLTKWYNKKAISKIRIPKIYRQRMLDEDLRKRRTINESRMITLAKEFGLRTPYIYFVDPLRAEIVMEFISGIKASKILTSSICFDIGKFVSTLHSFNIIHGDVTPSNFIVHRKITMIDMGLSFYSTRKEDKAMDIRLFKEILNSAYHSSYFEFFETFLDGYRSINTKELEKILTRVDEIDTRKRYAIA
ncbi:MAG TPA: KEOPS complex kinase/ATPase Bud32 [Nitrososphaeraceae archaeon]|nr:KEOPS complex kinase/ATPase Bud32 [Nitrososphaeraceae archaeon]